MINYFCWRRTLIFSATGVVLAALCLQGQVFPAFDFTDPGERPRWVANGYITNVVTTPEGLVVQLNGIDPYLRGPVTNYPADQPLWLRLKLKSETGGSCQLFYYTTTASEANSVRFTVPANSWVEGRLPVPALGSNYRIRIDPPGTSGTCILRELQAEPRGGFPDFDFRTIPDATSWDPTHHIASLIPTVEGLAIGISGSDPYTMGPARDFPPGKLSWLHLRLRSDTAGSAQVFYYTNGPTEANSVRFFVPAGQWHEAVAPMPALGPGWKLRIDPPGSSGTCLLERLWFDERTVYAPPVWPTPVVTTPGAEALSLVSGELQLLHERDALGAFQILVGGEPMAVGNPQGLIGILIGKAQHWLPMADGSKPLNIQAVGSGFRLSTTVMDAAAGAWTIQQEFQPVGPDAISVETRVLVSADREVLYLPVFTLLPGLGSFGTNKHQGLLAGLEYLENEASSTELDIIGPEARRLVPDRAKVTLPLMAIAAQDRCLGLSWQPQENVAPVFDSPDRQFFSAGHLFGLLFPGSDGFNRDEGKLLPYRGSALVANQPLVVRAIITGRRGRSVVPALQHFVELAGLPSLPTPLPGATATFDLLARGWLDSQIRSGDLYRHAFWPGFNPIAAADAAVWMKWLQGRTGDSVLDSRLAAAVPGALNSAAPAYYYNSRQIGHIRTPLPALVFNAPLTNAAQAALTAESHLGRFQSDGSVIYVSQPDGPDYGATHFAPDANGLTASVLLRLLEEALFAGDRTLIGKGLDHLRALNKFRDTVPRGAQTWEIPLHTPDILASAHLVRCYTLGYEITGEPEFLAQARYWAWTGVPFVYLVAPVTGTMGLYSTIAVYGGTAWVGSWFGRPVQWCGLVYADALNRLAPHDPAGPWRQLAKGIAASGVQQSWPASDAERQGLLPDFLLLKSQYRDGPAINPGTVQIPVISLFDQPMPYSFRFFREHGIWLHAAGAVGAVSNSSTQVSFTVTNWSNEASSLLLNGFLRAPRVKINGLEAALSAPHAYDSDKGRLALRIEGVTHVQIIYPALPKLGIRKSAVPGAVELRWDGASSRFQLETADHISGPAWSLVPVAPVIENGMIVSTQSAGATTGYFRLRFAP